MHNIFKKIIIVILALACIILPAMCIYAEDIKGEQLVGELSSDDIKLDISYGYDDSAKGGRYLPIHISYTAASDYSFDGQVAILVQESDKTTYSYSYPLSLSASEEKRKDYYIPIGYDANRILVKLIDSSEKEVASRLIKLNTDGNNAILNIGILSDSPNDLSYFDNMSINYGMLRTNTIELSSDTFPDNTRGLDLLDIIVISDYKIRNLREQQSRALMDWVSSGKVLIMGTGNRVDDTLGRYAPELLDDMYESPANTDIDLSTNPQKNQDETTLVNVPYVDVALHGGNVVMYSNGQPLLTTVNKSNGIIAVAGYDFVDVKEYALTNNNYVDTLISTILGQSRIYNIANQLRDDSTENYNSVQNLINVGDASKLPQINLYYIGIIAYVLLIGPGVYVFLKQRDLSIYYKRAVIALSIICVCIIYAMGIRTRFTDTFYHYASILDTDEDAVNDTTLINITNPYNISYDVNINKKYNIRPITAIDEADSTSTQLDTGALEDIAISYGEDSTGIKINDVGAFTPKFFRLESTDVNLEGAGFDGYISVFEDSIEGEITNNCAYDITNAAVILYGRLILIGDMKAGETKTLEGAKAYNIPLKESFSVGRIITGLDSFDSPEVTNSDYMSAMEKTNIIAYYIDNYLGGYSADARIIAFSRDSIDRDILVGATLESSGNTMLTSAISVDEKQDDRIYRSALMKSPQVISGSYDEESNKLYSTDPLVLSYNIGGDIDIDRINIEQVSSEVIGDTGAEQFNYFSGNIELYNYTTGDYDSLPADTKQLTSSQLNDYLTPGNNIIIRYTSNVAGNNADGTVLPMLTVVGRY